MPALAVSEDLLDLVLCIIVCCFECLLTLLLLFLGISHTTCKVVTESDDGQSEFSDSDDIERELAAWRAEDETLADRFYALKDAISPSTREKLVKTWRTSTSWATWGGKLAGNAVWVITTSALLVGLPLALAIENETMMVQQEKEMLAQQQGAQQVRQAANSDFEKRSTDAAFLSHSR